MFDHIEELYADMGPMMKKLRKKNYEERMEGFRRTHGHYFDEMTGMLEQADDPEATAGRISEVLTARVKETYSKKGKIPGRTHGDLDLFMIYFVYPAIQLTGSPQAKLLCDTICAGWNEALGSNTSYADYDTIYGGFRDRVFGIFR